MGPTFFFAKNCNFFCRFFPLPFFIMIYKLMIKKPLLLWGLHFLPLFLETIKFQEFFFENPQIPENTFKKGVKKCGVQKK